METKRPKLPLLIPALAGLVLALLLMAGTGLVRASNLLSPPARALLETTDDDSYSVNEDAVLSVSAPGVLANDGTGAADATLVNDADHGVLTLNLDGSFTYTPASDYFGADQFIYSSTNITGTQEYTTFIDVLSVNDAPVAVDDAYQATQNSTLNVSAPGVLANDSDVETDPLSAVPVTGPDHGTLNLLADGSFSYTPDTGFYGADSFTYQADDGIDVSSPATVVITVNDFPSVNDDASSTPEDVPIDIHVLFNDADFVGGLDYSTLAVIADGALGSSTITTEVVPRLRYTPDPNENGQDFVEYEVCDVYGLCGAAIVTIDVSPVNDAPVANNDIYSIATNNILVRDAARGVLANDTDIDTPHNLLTVDELSVSLPTHGTLSLDPDGSFTYTPDLDYQGQDSFTYRANDGLLSSATAAIVTIFVTNTQPPLTEPDFYTTSEDTPLNVPAPGVLANDEDPEQFPLTALLVTNPANGTVQLNPDGSFTYTPFADYHGTDVFEYQADDGSDPSDATVVTLTVTPVNDAPVAAADSYVLDEDTQLDVSAAQGVLANDQDVDGDLLTAQLVSGPAHGVLVLDSDGSFTYDPDSNYYGADSFVYRASDGALLSVNRTVSLTIAAVNDPPVAASDAYTYNLANENAGGVLAVPAPGVLANDTDIDSPVLTVSGVNNQPDHGSVQTNPDGSFSYTPDPDYNGLDSFEYLLNDGELSSVGRVDIQVDSVPPQVAWTVPAGITNGGVYFISNPLGQEITLAFEVTEQEGTIEAVTLRNWDTRLEQWQDLMAFPAPPYSLTFHSDQLGEFGYNDVRVYAYDDAGNLGTINVFIYRPGKIYLPNIHTP